jgi:hypothetical protein
MVGGWQKGSGKDGEEINESRYHTVCGPAIRISTGSRPTAPLVSSVPAGRCRDRQSGPWPNLFRA